MALQIRRGTDSDRLTITPSVGEPLYTTDTKKLYIGDGSTAGGNIVSGSDTDSASVSAIILNDVDSSYVQARQDLAYSSLTGAPTTVSSFTNDANYLDSTSVQGVINASYIQSNQTTYDFLDSSEAIALIDSAYVQARQTTDLSSSTTSDLTEGSNLYFTDARADARVEATADSAYVQARQIKYTNADFADSSFVTSQINNLIDGAPGTLDTLNEIAAALNDDDSAYSTLVGLINAKSDLDSTDAIALIDSAYVQARQTTYDFLDSSEAIALIDSAYVQARQSASTDSAAVIALIDSDYVRARQITPIPSFTKVSISGQGDVVADSDEGTANWASSSQQQKLTASDAATNDRFGYDLDISGDGNYALVAAPWESTQRGKAYVYLKSGTSWSEQATLTASDGGSNDYFGIGTKISEDGSTAVIGAKGAGSGINGTGKAYVYSRSGTTWTQQAALTASDAADGDLFGYAVDISDDGNTIVLGAYGEDTGGNARGQAYVFTRDSSGGSTWTEAQKFQSDDVEDGDNFGFAVAISGDGNNLVVGVPFEDSNGSSAGSAYIFTRDSDQGSIWSQQVKIQASDAAANQEFAYSVDMSTDGNTIALGSRDDTGGGNRGAAFIFTRSGSTWSQQAKLENANEADYDLFAGGGRGVSLSGTGNILVVGAYGDDDDGSQSGSTFVFTRTGTTWSQAKQIATSDAAASDENGFAVAIDKNGDTVLTGSYGKTSSTGAAYIWTAPLAVQLQDTLTLEAGSNITLTTSAATDTITIAASSSIDSAGTIALVDSAYIEARRPAETVFSVVNNGTSAYTFSGDGFPSTADNPTIYLTRGKTYKFGVNASGHPFQIRLSDGGSAYSNGVTNNGAQTGDVIFTVPMNAPNTLVYQCTVHSGMVGDIKIFNEDSFLDSSSVTNVIDATYIQANQTTYDFLDSSEAIALIDSAYVQARQTTYDFLDSAETIALIDSAYVQARQSGGEITIQEEGSSLTTAATTLNFVGSAVTASGTGTTKTITISDGGTDSAATIALMNAAGLNVPDNVNITAGADSDLKIYHDGSRSYISDQGTGELRILSSQLEIKNSSDDATGAVFTANGGASLYYNNSKKLETTDSGVNITGEITADSATISGLKYPASDGLNNQVIRTDGSGNLSFVSVAAISGAIDSAGVISLIDSSYVESKIIDAEGTIISIDSDLTTTDSAQVIHTFDKTTYRTVKYIAQLEYDTDSSYHSEELLITHNGTAVAMTSYAKILLDSDLGTFDARVSGSNIELTLSPTKANTSVKLRAIRTLA